MDEPILLNERCVLMNKYLMVFKNNHDAVNAESRLKEKKFNIMVMPTPTQITHSCGICIVFDDEVYSKSEEFIDDEKISYKNIYKISNNSLEILK